MTPQVWVDGLTIGQVLSQTADRFPDRDAIVFCQPDQQMTWCQFDAAVDSVARGLLSLGFQHGDHFGVWATNWPEWVLLQFATARIGVVLVTINPSYRPAELAFALKQSRVRGLAWSRDGCDLRVRPAARSGSTGWTDRGACARRRPGDER